MSEALITFTTSLLQRGKGLLTRGGTGSKALCNSCALLFSVLASRRSGLNVRPFQLPNSSSGVEEVGGGWGGTWATEGLLTL